MNNTLILLDQIGRTVIGNKSVETETEVIVENPALLLINANQQTNQLQLQILPLFFKEFQADKSTSTFWAYKKDNITLAHNFELSPQLVAQYNQLFGGAVNQQQNESPKVVKLFEEESETNS
jgi:hypothetical protein